VTDLIQFAAAFAVGALVYFTVLRPKLAADAKRRELQELKRRLRNRPSRLRPA
jgi:hypothetical protein